MGVTNIANVNVKYNQQHDHELYHQLEVCLQQVNLLIDYKLYDEALDDLEDLLKIDPNYSKAHYYQGIVYYKLKNYRSALTCLFKAIQLGEDSAFLYGLIGSIYMELEEFDQAVSFLSSGLELDFTNADLYRLRGIASYQYGDVYEAVDDLHSALRLDPDDKASKKMLAMINGFLFKPL